LVFVKADIAKTPRKIIEMKVHLTPLLRREIKLDDTTNSIHNQTANNVFLNVVRRVDNHYVGSQSPFDEGSADPIHKVGINLLEEKQLNIGRRRCRRSLVAIRAAVILMT
jgi:hypothetical protein